MITVSATQDNERGQGYLPAHAQQYIILKHTVQLTLTYETETSPFLFIHFQPPMNNRSHLLV